MPYSEAKNEHIRVDIFTDRLSPAALLSLAAGTGLIVISLDPELVPFVLEDSTTGLLSLLLLFTGIFLGLPIGASMVLACLVGMSHLMLAEAALSLLGMVSKTVASNYGWSVAPLFIFMGVVVAACQFSRDIFDTAYKWLGISRAGWPRLPSGPAASSRPWWATAFPAWLPWVPSPCRK